MGIYGNAAGFSLPKSYIFTDESGNEVVGVLVGEEMLFTATDNDVREGKVYASESGVSTGTKNIPSYRTTQGRRAIAAGKAMSIPLSDYNKYDYTKFQCIITSFNTNLSDSTAAIKISINDNIYNVGSTDVISVISKNADEKSIDLNITNNTGSVVIIHYMTYKEEV